MIVALMSLVITSCTGSACASTVDAPSSVGQLTPSDITSGSVTLSWGTAGGPRAEGYGIYRGPAGAADADLTLIATTDEAQSYTSTGLLAATRTSSV